VSQPSDSARLSDQTNRIPPGHSWLGNLGRSIIPEIKRERFAWIAHLAGTSQPVGQVLATDRRPGKRSPNRFEIHTLPERPQTLNHRLYTLYTLCPKLKCRVQQRSVIFPNKMAEDVDLFPLTLGGHLNSADQLDPDASRLKTGCRNGGKRVVISNCDRA
jgi:hypothetical protein